MAGQALGYTDPAVNHRSYWSRKASYHACGKERGGQEQLVYRDGNSWIIVLPKLADLGDRPLIRPEVRAVRSRNATASLTVKAYIDVLDGGDAPTIVQRKHGGRARIFMLAARSKNQAVPPLVG